MAGNRRGLMAALGLVLALCSPLPVSGAPRACLPDSGQIDQLAEAQRVFRPGDTTESEAIWDALMQAPAGAAPCRTVEIAWRISEFLKGRKEVPELALRYVNRGIAAYRKGGPEDDLTLGKLLKTAGHFFKRQRDVGHACRSLDAARRLFGAYGEDSAPMTQTRAQMADLGCPAPGEPVPDAGGVSAR